MVSLRQKSKTIFFIKSLLITLTIAISAKYLFINLRSASVQFRNFYLADFNFDKLGTQRNDIFKISKDVKKTIPPSSKVSTSFKKLNIHRIAARYALYPLELSDDYDYFIDFNLPANISDERIFTADGQAYKGKSFDKDTLEKQRINIPLRFCIFFAVIALNLLVGMNFMSRIGFTISETSKIWFIGTSFLLGYLVLTSAIWIMLLLGIELSRYSLLLLWGFILLLSFFARKNRNNKLRVKHRDIKNETFSINVVTIATFLFISLMFLMIVVTPVTDWDAMANWIMKSKVISNRGTLDLSYTHNNYYPVLWPLGIAAQFTLLGDYYDEVAQWTSALLFLAFITQLIGGLSFINIKGKKQHLIVLFYVVCFFSFRSMNTSNAENAFLAFNTAAILMLMQWINNLNDKRYLILGSLMALGMSVIKFEGQIIIVLLICSYIVLKIKCCPLLYEKRNPFCINYKKYWSYLKSLDLSLVFILPLILTVPFAWVNWVKRHGYYYSIIHFRYNITFARLIYVMKFNISVFLKTKFFFIIAIAIIYYCLIAEKRKWNEGDWFLLFISTLLIFFNLISTSGFNQDLFNAMDVIPRFMLRVMPLIIILFCSVTNNFAKK